ncbi:hypothetical protein [Mycobacterium riyadhense]|uniref:hypothetical protein n=1 Tax=Mycobacterium riyadhense TaxID=486698 RepID=UPI00146FA90D|nr:hypothetical protein [Mycobacterium riyadhense]MCV7145208.1 hypothetical protein [Mycobacterium riyadhense]
MGASQGKPLIPLLAQQLPAGAAGTNDICDTSQHNHHQRLGASARIHNRSR